MSAATTTAFELSFPIPGADGQPVTSLMLRRPRVKDLMAMQRAAKEHGGIRTYIDLDGKPQVEATEEAQIAGTLAMLASITGLPEASLSELDVSEFNKIEGILGGFFPKSPSGTSG